MKIRRPVLKLRHGLLITAAAAGALLSGLPPASAQTINPEQQDLSLPGSSRGEQAIPTDPGYNPDACDIPTGVGTGTTPGPEGTLTVVDLPEAERDPANSVLANVYAGCSPVRVVLSHDGKIAWVTARAQDDVLAFSTHRLLTDPSNALLSTTPVGVAPVGIQLFDNDRLIAVADSNRFTTGQTGTVTILDYRKALSGAGSAATVGTFEAGDFPRQWGLSNDDRFLYLTEFSSNVLAIFSVSDLVNNVRDSRPSRPPRAGWFMIAGTTPRISRSATHDHGTGSTDDTFVMCAIFGLVTLPLKFLCWCSAAETSTASGPHPRFSARVRMRRRRSP
jgi:hypothetical protein